MTTNADKVWWTRPGFVAAAAFLLLVTILAIWISTSSNGTDIEGAAETPTSSTSSPPTPPTDGGRAVPPTSAPSTSVADLDLTRPPANTTWALWQGIALPSSPDHGPADVHDGVAEGYAHTPPGALIAAVQIMYRASYGPTAQVIEAQVAPGPGRDLLLEQAHEERGTVGVPQIAGFKFDGYSTDAADVQLLVRTTEGSMTSFLLRLEWHDDWQLVATLSGDVLWSTSSVPTMTGYQLWSGVA